LESELQALLAALDLLGPVARERVVVAAGGEEEKRQDLLD
jgi:hypothetical protein